MMKMANKQRKLGEKKRENTEAKLNFIPDIEIDLAEIDLLGTLPYVDTLEKAITDCDTPFTIGILGGWGSGKSSILRTLQNRFSEDPNSSISIFIYDAWKYAHDSFRRTFILELKKFFRLETTHEFDGFYKDKNVELPSQIGFSKIWWVYLILIIFPIVFINAESVLRKSFELTPFLISLFFSGINIFLAKAFINRKISIIIPRTFAPEQFEEIFKEIIFKITRKERCFWRWIKKTFGRRNIKKVIIAIDNIDRCQEERVIKLLLTIKNFLEIDNVVFILPVAEYGLMKYTGMDKEFLRKLFNTSLRIKKFSESELFEFSKKLNKKYKLNLSNTILSMICQEFSKNPRRIIQFLNVFQTEFLQAKKQEEEGLLIKGAVTGNEKMFTKILIIKDEWPALFNKIADDLLYINKIDSGLDEQRFKYDIKRSIWILAEEKGEILLTTEQRRFFLRTRHFGCKNLEPFLINKDVFPDIPDEINRLVYSQEWDSIKVMIKEELISFDRLFDFISKKIDEDVIKRGLFLTTGMNIIYLLIKMVMDSEYSEKLNEIFQLASFGKVRLLLSRKELKEEILKFEPKGIVKLAKWFYKKGIKDLAITISEAIERVELEENEEE